MCIRDRAEPVGDVLHQRGLAVARRRDQHQQAHQVAALGFTDRAHLFGEVVADQRQVDFVDQLVAHERGQRLRLEFRQAQRFAFARDQRLSQLLAAKETRQERLAMATQALGEVVDAERDRTVDDARMLSLIHI